MYLLWFSLLLMNILRKLANVLQTQMQRSGTVSRNVYGLYKLGYLETRGDGERVNYITRPDALERLFRWVLEYVSEQK